MKNKAIKGKSKVNYTQKGKGKVKTDLSAKVDTNIVKNGYKIGKNVKAKKYEALRQKQRLANKMIKESHEWLDKDHRAYKELREKKRTFYNKRGLKSSGSLSFKNLTRKDLKDYERMLDSILDTMWFDKDKYDEWKEKARENIQNDIIGDEDFTDDMVDDFIDLMENDLISDIMDMGVKYDIADIYKEFHNYDLSKEDFVRMTTDFYESLEDGDVTINDYFTYSDTWLQATGVKRKED